MTPLTPAEAAWAKALNDLRRPDSDLLNLAPGASLDQVREAVASEFAVLF